MFNAAIPSQGGERGEGAQTLGVGRHRQVGRCRELMLILATLMAWLTYEYAFTKTGSIPDPCSIRIIRLTVTVHTYGLLC